MKHLMKTLLLGLIGSFAVVAVGSGSASATVLCKTNTTLPTGSACPSTDKYPASTLIESSLSGSSVVKSGETTLNTCTGTRWNDEVSGAGSSTATHKWRIFTFDWESCVSGVDIELTGTLELHHIAGTHNARLTVLERFRIGLTIFGTNCLYEPAVGSDIGSFTGGAPASTAINTALTEAEPKKAICPDTATWTATFKVTKPSPLYAAAA